MPFRMLGLSRGSHSIPLMNNSLLFARKFTTTYPTLGKNNTTKTPRVAPLSRRRRNNYCSLADGLLIAAIFHRAFHCPPPILHLCQPGLIPSSITLVQGAASCVSSNRGESNGAAEHSTAASCTLIWVNAQHGELPGSC